MRTIECGDALDVLKVMPAEWRFDVVIADPPYNIGVDFGVHKDRMSLNDYIAWTRQWIAACGDRLRSGGVMYIYGYPEILARVAVGYPMDAQKWLQWHYTNKTAPSSKFWQRSHESILCLWRGDEGRPSLSFDRVDASYDVIAAPALAGGAGRAERWFLCKDHANEVYPPAEIVAHRNCDVLKHPTQKPAELTRRLIQSKMDETGVSVLIPFAGSGSECVVAQELGCDFYGIELNPLYVRLGMQWLAQAKQAQRRLL